MKTMFTLLVTLLIVGLLQTHMNAMKNGQRRKKKAISLKFTPTEILNLHRKTTTDVVVHGSTSDTRIRYIYVESLDGKIAKTEGDKRFPISDERCLRKIVEVEFNSSYHSADVNSTFLTPVPPSKPAFRCFNATFRVTGVSLGKTSLALYVGTGSKTEPEPDIISNLVYDSYLVSVIRDHRDVNDVLHWCLIGMMIVTLFCLSAKVDISDIVDILKSPKGPCVALAMMFLFKPLFSYGLGTVFSKDAALRFGVFALGCCPEGAISLIWICVLDGDLGLGVIIAAGEAILSFGAIPLWMVALGRKILRQDAEIPFVAMAMNSAEVLTACSGGLLLRRFAPLGISRKVGRMAKVFATVTLLFLVFTSVYCNIDLWPLMGEWRVMTCGTLLPGLGGLLGGVIAWICCQSWDCVKAIALAVILQGIDVPIAIVQTSLPVADAQLAYVIPVVAAIFANVALWPPLLLHWMKQGCGMEGDVVVHTTNTTMSMKRGDANKMFKNSQLTLHIPYNGYGSSA